MMRPWRPGRHPAPGGAAAAHRPDPRQPAEAPASDADHPDHNTAAGFRQQGPEQVRGRFQRDHQPTFLHESAPAITRIEAHGFHNVFRTFATTRMQRHDLLVASLPSRHPYPAPGGRRWAVAGWERQGRAIAACETDDCSALSVPVGDRPPVDLGGADLGGALPPDHRERRLSVAAHLVLWRGIQQPRWHDFHRGDSVRPAGNDRRNRRHCRD